MKSFKHLSVPSVGFFTLLASFSAFAGLPNDLACRLALSKNAMSAITAAVDSGGYKVRILQGDVGGKPRTVVLLGEKHIKSEEHSNLGKAVLNEFSAYGYEGADVSKTIGSKVFSLSIGIIMKMAKVISFGKEKHGSTIGDAIESVNLGDTVEVLAKFAESQGLLKMTAEERSKVTVKIGERELTGQKLMDILAELQEKHTPKIGVHLEANHKPGIAEHAASLVLPVIVGNMLYTFGRDIFNTGTSAITQDGNLGDNTVTLVAGVVGFIAMAKVMSWLQSHKTLYWIGDAIAYLNPLTLVTSAGLLYDRNKTMALNTVKAFQDHDDVPAMLNIVGSAHLRGMANRLKKQYGFTEFAFDDVKEVTGDSETP